MHNSNLIYIYIFVSMGSKITFECVIELSGFAGVEDGAVGSVFTHSATQVNKP